MRNKNEGKIKMEVEIVRAIDRLARCCFVAILVGAGLIAIVIVIVS